MIGYVKGNLLWHSPASQADMIIVMTGGVGYELSCPVGVVKVGVGEECALWVHSITREDGTKLYGFADRASMEGFRSLIDISGVGAKVGMALLSAHGWAGLCVILQAGDVASLTRAEGVGKKIASRIALEMSNKLPHLASASLGSEGSVTGASSTSTSLQAQASSALVNLGYAATVAQQAVQAVPEEQSASLESLISAALRQLSTG